MTTLTAPRPARTHQETLRALDEKYVELRDQLPREKRWCDWTAEERVLEEKRIVVEGMKYALTTLRLSRAAEIFLYGSDLDELIDRIHAGITAREHGAGFAIGWPTTFLNEYACEVYEILRGLAAMFGKRLR